MELDSLENKIGYSFKDRALLTTALTHSSYSNERHGQGCPSYERLEFLGDSILGLLVAEHLYGHRPLLPEGQMTRLRAELVCEQSLHQVALRLDLGRYMRLGRGEEHTGGRERPSILADMVEAMLAAMYLDGGMELCRRFVKEQLLDGASLEAGHRSGDYKTQLQELVQKQSDRHISYALLSESGPDHNKTFSFAVLINGIEAGRGTGRTKKEAEQMAAKRALEGMEP